MLTCTRTVDPAADGYDKFSTIYSATLTSAELLLRPQLSDFDAKQRKGIILAFGMFLLHRSPEEMIAVIGCSETELGELLQIGHTLAHMHSITTSQM